jgi:sorting nexin-8
MSQWLSSAWHSRSKVCHTSLTRPILTTQKELTLDAVQTLAQKNELPTPTALDITTLQNSTIKATFPPPSRGPATAGVAPGLPAPAYSTEPDPWSAASRGLWSTGNGALPTGGVPAASSILSSGLPPQWWKGMEQVNVTIHGQQGMFFNRFMVYSVQSYSRGVTVLRRYSEFVFLWDCLVKRYPFRLLPQLPPKRIAGKPHFVLTREPQLTREVKRMRASLNRGEKDLFAFSISSCECLPSFMCVSCSCHPYYRNHPVIKDDGVLSVFLTEPDLEGWKRRTTISYDEEALTKRVDRVDEMSIPRDLEEKLAYVGYYVLKTSIY